MEKNLEALAGCPLFAGIPEEDLSSMLRCLGANVSRYDRGGTVIPEGGPARYVGIVLSGSVQIVQIDYFGNRSIVGGAGPSELFGESFACAGADSMPVSAVAAEPSQIMLIDCRRILHTCGSACAFHQRMIFNLLKVVAGKNIAFQQKIEVTSKRTTRGKLIAYLTQQGKRHNSSSFTIPYNRQELADYLEVERSGLSVELGKLRRQGLIETEGKRFRILRDLEGHRP